MTNDLEFPLHDTWSKADLLSNVLNSNLNPTPFGKINLGISLFEEPLIFSIKLTVGNFCFERRDA